MILTVKSVFKIKDDFENVFIAKSGIHIKPKYDELKLSSRSVSSTRYEDVYIIEPKAYYYIEFNEEIDLSRAVILKTENALYAVGLLMSLSLGKLYIYNTTENIIYIQKDSKMGEVIYG